MTKRGGRECAICGERNHSTSGHEPVERGGRDSGWVVSETGETRKDGQDRAATAAVNPAAQEIERHGYDPREHPFVLQQAERIRALEAELDITKAERNAARLSESQATARAEKAEAAVIVLSHKADVGMKWRNEASRLEADLAETEKGLEIQALISHNAVARAEKAEAELKIVEAAWFAKFKHERAEVARLEALIQRAMREDDTDVFRGHGFYDECHVGREDP